VEASMALFSDKAIGWVAKELCFQARTKDLFFLESIYTSCGAHKLARWMLASSFFGVKASRAQT